MINKPRGYEQVTM